MDTVFHLPRQLRLSTTGKVRLIVILFVVIAVALLGIIQLQGDLFAGVRSYVRGEGLWAKAQKNAILQLEHYSYSGGSTDWAAFEQSMQVYRGDGRARVAMEQSPPDTDAAREGFLMGQNAPDDVGDMIWFFLHFRNISYLREAVGVWRQGDVKMRELESVARQMRADFARGQAGARRLAAHRAHLRALNVELTLLENRFSTVLGEGARWTRRAVWAASLAVLALCVGAGLLVSRQIIRSIGRAEEELRASESRFRSLKESNTIGIASWDTDGRFTDANDLLLRMLGYTRAEMLSGTMNWKAMTPAEYRGRDELALAELATKGYCEPFEKVLLHKNGSRIPIYLGASMIGDDRQNGITYILDISERKKAEEALRLAAVVFDSSSNGVLVTDASMHILSVNQALCEISGFREDELIGRTPSVLHSGYTTAEQYQAMWNSLLNTGRWHGDIMDRNKDGELLPLSISISRITDDEGDTTHYVVIMNDISDRKAEEAHLWHIAHHDALTGLPNRTLFNDRIEQLIKRTSRNGSQFAVLFYDLDRFKPINDRYGHETGDKLLKTVADRLKTHVRDTDTVTRLGGDEFVVLLEGIDGLDAAKQLQDKTVAAICESCVIDGHKVELGVSVGLSIYPDHGSDAAALIQRADAEMYAMKRQAVATSAG